MEMDMMKVESESETCCICGSGGELASPEEYDASNAGLQMPLRNMLMHLNHNKVIPEGRFCGGCVGRAVDAYELSTALRARTAPSLSDKIRALRRRLHELTQKIDVFIVVGGPGAGATASYSEDDIIMVEKEALAAAAAADAEELEHARNARGDHVYQCSVCPLSFQRVSELRAHGAAHAADALHSCWTCGAQFSSRGALRTHAAAHAAPAPTVCHLCDASFANQAEMRAHEGVCGVRACPLCGAAAADRAGLAAHAAAAHGRGAPPPYLCPACFLTLPAPDLLTAHQLTHRQAKQFVCGFGECVVRFGSRANLLAHIRAAHSAPPAPATPAAHPAPAPGDTHACDQCDRKFASSAALKRHQHAHARTQRAAHTQMQEESIEMEVEQGETVEQVLHYITSGEGAALHGEGEGGGEEEGEEEEYGEGEVEYLEVETLDDAEYVYDVKTEGD